MAIEKNITMRQYNGTDYDTLYPATTVKQVQGLSDELNSNELPVGTIMESTNPNFPNKMKGTWLPCDGSAIDKTKYPELWNATENSPMNIMDYLKIKNNPTNGATTVTKIKKINGVYYILASVIEPQGKTKYKYYQYPVVFYNASSDLSTEWNMVILPTEIPSTTDANYCELWDICYDETKKLFYIVGECPPNTNSPSGSTVPMYWSGSTIESAVPQLNFDYINSYNNIITNCIYINGNVYACYEYYNSNTQLRILGASNYIINFATKNRYEPYICGDTIFYLSIFGSSTQLSYLYGWPINNISSKNYRMSNFSLYSASIAFVDNDRLFIYSVGDNNNDPFLILVDAKIDNNNPNSYYIITYREYVTNIRKGSINSGKYFIRKDKVYKRADDISPIGRIKVNFDLISKYFSNASSNYSPYVNSDNNLVVGDDIIVLQPALNNNFDQEDKPILISSKKCIPEMFNSYIKASLN